MLGQTQVYLSSLILDHQDKVI